MGALVVFTLITFLFVVVNFIFYLLKGRILTNETLWTMVVTWTMIFMPVVFLAISDFTKVNDCCNASAIFSPDHRYGIYFLILSGILAYISSFFRKEIFTPVIEFVVNLFLILGLVINVLLCFHLTTSEDGPLWWIFGNVPIIILLLIELSENQKRLKNHIEESSIERNGLINEFCYSILILEPIYKFPILLMLLVPIVILLSLFLMIFGQKPDSIVRSFTDTYKHGFSQLDHECLNVSCGGHFLSSVGANGHRAIVKPVRYGERKGKPIICNRQLLISNAFEELIQERLPNVHYQIRKRYNRVGDVVHKYYTIFNVKIVSDLIYILMKPLEWLFLLTLYIFDKKPENRIASQYLNKVDRLELSRQLKGE